VLPPPAVCDLLDPAVLVLARVRVVHRDRGVGVLVVQGRQLAGGKGQLDARGSSSVLP
jgi:hypothetical protein